ncbi:MAG: hypothetical protein WC333_01565 [Dehalococcoidia bacterium]|jgi:hypothetical protein
MTNFTHGSVLLLKAIQRVDPGFWNKEKEKKLIKQRLFVEKEKSTVLEFKKGCYYLDFTNIPDGGDLKRFKGTESGVFIEGDVKEGEIRVLLKNEHIITTKAESISNFTPEEIEEKVKLIFGG